MADNIRPAGVFDTNYVEDIKLNRTQGDRMRVWGAFAALLVMPLLTSEGFLGIDFIPSFWVSLSITIAILIIAAQGLNILVGYSGQISLGHAAFMAVGAYSGALFARGFDFTLFGASLTFPSLPFWFALPLAALFTGGVGLLFGLPSLRVKGFYLAMATLAAQFIIPWVIKNPLSPWTNAPDPLQGIPAPGLFGIQIGGNPVFASDVMMYYIIIPLSVFLMWAARNIIRTRTGRAFISVRDNDLAAELLGINIFWYKLQAFFISALYAGIAGVLMAFDKNTLTLDFFNLEQSIILLAILVIGGAGYPLGPVFGVLFFEFLEAIIVPTLGPVLNGFLPNILPFIESVNIGTSLRPIMFGTALLLFLIFEPRGIAYRYEILRIAWKIRPYSY